MSQRPEHLTDDLLAQFLRTRSADAELGLLDDIVRTVGATPQDRPWPGLRPILLPRRTLLIAAIALLLATMGAVAVGSRFLQPDLSAGPFLGTWVATDLDGSTPTMVIQASEGESVEMVMHDDFAAYELIQDGLISVCSGASTMIGTGRFQGVTELVFPAPVLTCDDGSQPVVGEPHWTPLEEQLQNLTFTHDPGTDTLTDNFGSVWTREGADPSPEPTTPPPSEAEVTELLNGFLEARVAGEGAQQYLGDPEEDIPLLYATTSGAPYERAEFERVLGIEWPYGNMAFKVRLFAGDTVVEQLLFMGPDAPLKLGYDPHGFGTDIAPTTEDGQPVPVSYSYFDDEMIVHAAHPWIMSDYGIVPFGRLIPEGPGVPPTTDGGQRNDWDHLFLLADPELVGPVCQTGPAPADAAALAESIRSDLGLEATDPVAVSAGEVEGLMMDVKIVAGASVCWNTTDSGDPSDHPGVLYALWDQRSASNAGNGHATGHASGEWMRLYLFDVPEGSSMRILGIAIVAPESTFERAVEAAAPVVDSVEFHAP